MGGHLGARQVRAQLVQARLVGLDGEHVVAAGGEDQRRGVVLDVRGLEVTIPCSSK